MAADERPVVLYVDDEPINLRVFDANFRNHLRVITCHAAAEALQILTQRGHEIAVLISDQRMPGMTGVELLEKSRQVAPDVQRMIITAYSDMQAVIESVNRGQVSRYFVKPWVKEELLAALEDAVQIHRLQGRLREFESRLSKSERLAAIGQVSAGIAHELMNPVSYMTQNIETLRGELKTVTDYVVPFLKQQPDESVQRTLDELPSILADVETGAKHIRQVAFGIRSQARGDDPEPHSELADVAQFAVKLARSEVRHHARLVTEGPADVHVVGGPVKLCQVLLNLIVNAAHAIEGAGRPGLIEIRWRPGEEDAVDVTVSDNGTGIPAAIREKVFDPFFTTKPAGQGTGLGLAICRDLVKEMGGDLSLTSTEGSGTTVFIRLKKAPPPEAPGRPAAS
ncbi:MAG TPA: ATP-binding protein [Myxococcaceae bacterium]|nr:ATP-binding protein [Myxococcaceae bacterium]